MITDKSEKSLVLLVDDMPANLHVLAASLKEVYRVKVALDGPSALELARQTDRPDIILLDMMMPEMDGTKVLQKLREQPETAGIPVIFVTADNSEQSQLDVLDLGADDYITKPVVLTILLARIRNLLQRKQVEDQLRLASHVFKFNSQAIMINDADNRILNINSAFTRITGYELSDVKGKDPKLLSSGLTTPEEYRAMWQSINDHDFWQGELWDRHKDGCLYPKLMNISVVRNSVGKIEYFIGSYTNISSQKAAEEEIRQITNHLRESEERTRTILDTAVDGIITIDENRIIISVNAAVEKMFGYCQEELIGRNVDVLMPEPFHTEHDTYVQNYLRSGVTKIIGIGREVRGKRKDGSVFPMELAVSESTVVNQRLFTGIIRDITERKEVEEKLQDAYQLIRSDLEAAATIQKNLLPGASILGSVRFDWLFIPSSFVAGDIFNYFHIDEGVTGFYLLDVSGHGVPAAMLSVSMNWMLSNMLQNGGNGQSKLSRHQMTSPSQVLDRLNTIFGESRTAGQYITMIYGVLDCNSNRLTMSQAGLPAPVYCSAAGVSSIIGSGGFPIGLIPDATYEDEAIDFYPGDRLFLYSDGITECCNAEAIQFSDERLVALTETGAGQKLDNLLGKIEATLYAWRGENAFDDDVTLLAIERESL